MANMPSVDRTISHLKISNAAYVALAKVASEQGTNYTDVARSIIEREMEHVIRLFTDEDRAAVSALKKLHIQKRREYCAGVAKKGGAR